MTSLKLYLDSGILIAIYDKKDIDIFTKENRNIQIKKTLKIIKESKDKIKLYISNWTLVEAIRVLVKKKGFSESKVNDWINELLSTQSLLKNEIQILKFNKEYSIENLFFDIKRALVTSKEKIHTADVINVIYMKKHKISKILTFDDMDYKGFSNIYPFNPFKVKFEKK